MKPTSICAFLILLFSCNYTDNTNSNVIFSDKDIPVLKEMVNKRESAMVNKDIHSIMQQFDTDANFINGGGFYFEGVDDIRNFHESMFLNDSLTYTYKTGQTTIKPISDNVVALYYPWQQNWTLKKAQSDTFKEVGLMTIIAVKSDRGWKWKCITNQRTKEFFENVKQHKSRGIK